MTKKNSLETQLEEYKTYAHKEDCQIRRNRHMSTLAAVTVNQVMGLPKCSCGLTALLEQRKTDQA